MVGLRSISCFTIMVATVWIARSMRSMVTGGSEARVTAAGVPVLGHYSLRRQTLTRCNLIAGIRRAHNGRRGVLIVRRAAPRACDRLQAVLPLARHNLTLTQVTERHWIRDP